MKKYLLVLFFAVPLVILASSSIQLPGFGEGVAKFSSPATDSFWFVEKGNAGSKSIAPFNSMFGSKAAPNIENSVVPESNTGWGAGVFPNLIKGALNVSLGRLGCFGLTDGNSNICLGTFSGPSSPTASNELTIGHDFSPITRVWIGEGGAPGGFVSNITISPTDENTASGGGTGASLSIYGGAKIAGTLNGGRLDLKGGDSQGGTGGAVHVLGANGPNGIGWFIIETTTNLSGNNLLNTAKQTYDVGTSIAPTSFYEGRAGAGGGAFAIQSEEVGNYHIEQYTKNVDGTKFNVYRWFAIADNPVNSTNNSRYLDVGYDPSGTIFKFESTAIGNKTPIPILFNITPDSAVDGVKAAGVTINASDKIGVGSTGDGGNININLGTSVGGSPGVLKVDGSLAFTSNGQAPILVAPDAGCWKLSVDNVGSLSTTSVTCP